jgi:hypothetical protein
MAPRPLSLVRLPAVALRTGARVGLGVAGWWEQQTMSLLGSRIEHARDQRAPDPGPGAPSYSPSGKGGPPDQHDLGPRMQALLEQALANTPADSSLDLYHRILDQLSPDEARILGALSDGHASPLLHVRPLSPAGILGEPTLENASLIGKMANVSLPQLTPQYVTHLLALGLVQVGSERSSLKDDYQILMADPGVLKASRKATRGPISPRYEKHTLRLSPLGRSLWAACFPEPPESSGGDGA